MLSATNDSDKRCGRGASAELRKNASMKLVSIPANPVPEGAVMGVLKTPDGKFIRFARWPPPSERKGTVCVFHGRIEFIEKYFEVVRDLNARGFAVATLDWRGQGLSDRMLGERRKGHVANFAEYDTDLEAFMRDVVLPDCPPPLFGLANSMGAAVLIRAAARGHRWFERLVLCAPMIRLTNIPMLPVVSGLDETRKQILIYSLILAPIGLAPTIAGFASWIYGAVALICCIVFVQLAWRVYCDREGAVAASSAKKLFAFSLLYVFVLFAALLADNLLARLGYVL